MGQVIPHPSGHLRDKILHSTYVPQLAQIIFERAHQQSGPVSERAYQGRTTARSVTDLYEPGRRHGTNSQEKQIKEFPYASVC